MDILIKASKNFKDQIRVVVVGDHKNKYDDLYKELVMKHGLDVVFVGWVHHEDLVYFYLNSDLFVLPNKYCPGEYEPLESYGIVVDEALSLNIPVIVTEATGCGDDVVQNKKTGRIIKQNCIDDLENTLADFLENPIEWKKMGANGQKVVKEKNKLSYNNFKEFFRLIQYSS